MNKVNGGKDMNQQIKERIVSLSLGNFRLPRYREIPDVGLYLEQTAKYINDVLAPLEIGTLTTSMVSNYVKKGLIANPVKKQYSRRQIAHLIYIAVVKSVLTIDDIRLMVSIQEETYDVEVAYDYFCMELENVLDYVFSVKDTLDHVGVETDSGEKVMLRNTIITVGHKVYLTKLCAALRAEEEN